MEKIEENVILWKEELKEVFNQLHQDRPYDVENGIDEVGAVDWIMLENHVETVIESMRIEAETALKLQG
jgi:hypothetical protein